MGGSLGARTLNQSVTAFLDEMAQSGIQIIWQTGKYYIDKARADAQKYESREFIVTDFVSRMDYAYAVADLVISRAGASSISELCLLAKPVILVPSPNVAEDHQTSNAMALVNKNAALMVRDADALRDLIPATLNLIKNSDKLTELAKNISLLAQKDSAGRIAEKVLEIIRTRK